MAFSSTRADFHGLDGSSRELGLVLAEEDIGDAGEDIAVAGEPAGRVEAFGQRPGALQREPAMARADAEEAAIARRRPDRAAGVGAERDIGEAQRGGCLVRRGQSAREHAARRRG